MSDEIRQDHDKMFRILHSPFPQHGPRLARLALPKRNIVDTPNSVSITSRGVVPHLSHDNLASKTDIRASYLALEDFIEKAASNKIPPLLSDNNTSHPSPLRNFISASDDHVLILGPRRLPSVSSPWTNTPTSFCIYTSVGFGKLKPQDYATAVHKLKPDIVVGLGDIPNTSRLGSRRIEKMSSTTEFYTQEYINLQGNLSHPESSSGMLFAPILPVAYEQQSYYIERLLEDWLESISGLALYDSDVLLHLPAALQTLPRLSFSHPSNPHLVLREVGLGVDLFLIPFIGAATDAGIALDFRFPAPGTSSSPHRPLGQDMWSSDHAASLLPMVEGCDCFACLKHHRAYVRHLLSAKEMLAWALLQIHNNRIMDLFFIGIRKSTANGTFAEDVETFARVYEFDLPKKTGQGPRVRGYEYKSEGPGEAKRNEPSFKVFDANDE